MGPIVEQPHSLVFPGTPSAQPVPAGVPDRGGWTTVLQESFGASGFPYAGWQAFAQGTGSSAFWGRTTHRRAVGTHSLYSVGSSVAAPGPYPINVISWAIYGPFDLSEAAAVEMTFQYWSRTESGYDFFGWYSSTNGVNFTGSSVSGNSNGWVNQTFDLSGRLGEPQVWVAFVFTSDFIVNDEGSYVDDVRIRYLPGGDPAIEVTPSALTITEPGARMWTPPVSTPRLDVPLPEHVPGRVVVQFESGASFDPATGRSSSAGVEALAARFGLSGARAVFTPTGRDGGRFRAAGLDRIYALDFQGPYDVRELVRAFQSLPEVTFAEPDLIVRLGRPDPPERSAPNDPLFASQWGLNNTGQAVSYTGTIVGTPGADINVQGAWTRSTGSQDVIVAIIDEGVDLTHPEFAGRLVPGRDTFNNNDDPSPTGNDAHGTAAAGIAAAAGNNALGVAGVAWNVRIMPIKSLQGGNGSWVSVANGVQWAADNGAHVISMSLGGEGGAAVLQTAVNYAFDAGAVLVASAGNENNSIPQYPAAYSNVISIGAMSPCNTRKTPTSCDGESWWGSSFGAGLDVMAPGARIHTTDITGPAGYSAGDYTATFNGTSAACPFAAGVIALMLSVDPWLTADEIRSILQTSAVDMGVPGYDAQTGFGRLNAAGALQLVSSGDAYFTVSNTGEGILSVSALGATVPWLTVSPTGPFTLGLGASRNVRVDVDWAQVQGVQQATITIASNDPAQPSVSVPVTAIAAGTPPALAVAPPALTATVAAGTTETLALALANAGGAPLAYALSASADWLSAAPDEGTIAVGESEAVSVTVDAAGLSPDVYTATLTIASNDPAQPTVPVAVTLTVTAPVAAYPRTLAGPTGWRMLAPPTGSVTPGLLASISLVQGVPGSYPGSAPNLYTHYTGQRDPDTNAAGFLVPSGLDVPLASGRGFIWYHWASPVSLPGDGSQGAGLPVDVYAFGGAPAGPVSTTFTAAERHTSDDGFYLLGNPYGEPLCAGRIGLAEPSAGLLSAVFHHWNAETGQYEIVVAPTDAAMPWDGFFAEVADDPHAGGAPLTFTFEAPGACAPREAAQVRLALELGGTIGGVAVADHAALVVFDDEATPGWDRLDGSKMTPLGATFATLAPVGLGREERPAPKAVESLPFPASTVEIPLSLRTTGAGQLEVRLANPDALPAGWQVWLRDDLLGTTVDARLEAMPVGFEAAVADARRVTLVVEPLGVDTEGGPAAEALALEAVYPNPASADARVAFTLGVAGEVTVGVYDLLGRSVRESVHGPLAPGRHVVRLATGDLSSGVYVVRVQAAGGVVQQRLTVLR